MYARTIVCPKGHEVQSYFKDEKTFKRLEKLGQVACEICGTHEVEVKLAAPHINRGADSTGQRTRIQELMDSSEDVGERLPEEARAMHDGSAPMRPIRGEATIEEAQKLVEEGILLIPIPN
jgi:hypothetical protein